MMRSQFNKVDSFVAACAHQVHDLRADTLRIMLSDQEPTRLAAFRSEIVEIRAGNGYSAGGAVVPILSSGQADGRYKLSGGAVEVVRAIGGPVGPFRYAVLYNDDAANDELLCWWDRGASVVLEPGDIFVVDLDQETGILTLE